MLISFVCAGTAFLDDNICKYFIPLCICFLPYDGGDLGDYNNM
jgi:hypothetical protein